MYKRSYEMGYTPVEFRKALLGQFNSNTSYTITAMDSVSKPSAGNGSESMSWSIEDQSESISIEVSIAVAAPRKIALLSLPVLNTEFAFKQITDTQHKEFMKTFFRYFHKGGG